jgi:APA family basic amino acid/polyamine antiporter
VEAPDRTIPRATLLGVAIATAVYIGSTVAVMGLIAPASLAVSTAPFADAARLLWGDWAAYAVAGGAVISCFGALNGWILNTGRIPYAAARDGLFPARFGRLSPRGTPTAALVFSALLVVALICANYSRGLVGLFEFAILLSTMTLLVPYLFSAAAQMTLALAERGLVGRTATLWISGVAFVFSLWAIAGTGEESVYWGGILLLCGLPVFAVMRARGAAPPA